MNYFFSLLICLIIFSCTRTETPKAVLPQKDTVITNPPGLSLESEITCPKCNFRKKEMMPTDQCLLKYTCTNCRAELYPDEKDCCVFCTYGTHKCPSKQ